MQRTTSTTTLATIIGTLLIAYGCSATMPPRDAAVESARRDFLVIAQQPYIQQHAPVAYARAKESMDKTEKMWRQGAEVEELQHQAYLTSKRAAIAREEAGLNRAQEQIAQADERRQDVLLQARESELEAVRQRAESAEQRAESARMDAEQARAQAERMQSRAGELSQELSDLEAQQTERGVVITLSNILFDTGEADLKPGADNVLDRISDVLQEYPDHSLMIEGFTDSVGSFEYNEQLSQQRAQAVRSALVTRGISPDRIQTRGYGERFPIATNDTPTGRQLNRRVEVIVSNDQNPVEDRSS